MRKVFITGDAGMLGSAISYSLKQDNNYKVIEFPELETYSNKYHFHNRKQIKKFEVDITNVNSLKSVFRFLDKDSIVINCAAYVNTDKCEQFSYEAVMSNVIGTQNIIEKCKEVNCTLIHFSTTAVFDPVEYMKDTLGIFDETAIINPKTIYGATKYASELAVKQSMEKFVIIKPVFIYGNYPFDNSSNITKIIKNILFEENEVLDITLSEEYLKNYFHVDYFALMMKQLIDNVELCYKEDFIISRHASYSKSFKNWLQFISIVLRIEEEEVLKTIKLHPEKDYLQNHLGLSVNFYKHFKGFELPEEVYNDYQQIAKVHDSILKHK